MKLQVYINCFPIIEKTNTRGTWGNFTFLIFLPQVLYKYGPRSVLYHNTCLINVLTERLKWRPMLRQMRESMLRQTLHVSIASNIQMIQSSDWPKLCCALWRYVTSPLLSDHRLSFQALVDTFIHVSPTCRICVSKDIHLWFSLLVGLNYLVHYGVT